MVGPEEAKDVLQNVMTKAMTSMPQDEEFQMKPWLYRVARNECIDQLRQARRTATGLDPDSRPDGAGGLDPHKVAVERERLDQLVNDLKELPEKQRATLVMRELSGLSYAEIAGSTGTSESAAKQLVYEARLSLQQADLGRRLDCAEVRESISSQDRRRLRARKVRSHMRACRECSEFESSISRRQAGYQSLFPVLPLGASLGILEGLHGGGSVAGGAGAGGAAAATTGGVLSGGVATGLIAKGAAVLVVAGSIGVGATEVAKNRGEKGSTSPQAQITRTDPSGFAMSSKAADFKDVIPAAESGPVKRGPDSVGDGSEGSRPEQLESDTPRVNGPSSGATTSTVDSVTPGSGVGQGSASLPGVASEDQSRADEASSAKPGQTGQAPPSQKPTAPPGQSSPGGNSGGTSKRADGVSVGTPGKSADAPAVGKPDSPGKSPK